MNAAMVLALLDEQPLLPPIGPCLSVFVALVAIAGMSVLASMGRPWK